MLAPARNVLLPRLSTFCRSNVQSLNAFGRVGSRQANAGTWAAHPARVGKKVGFTYGSVAVLGLGVAFWRGPTVNCDSSNPSPRTTPAYGDNLRPDLPSPPVSSVSLYELGFGTVAGLCAGVFVKKGAKAAAWLLGGVFVLLQYLSSQSLVRVDWSRAVSRFESWFHTVDGAGKSRPPTVLSVWKRLIDFLTADFQPRASFIAGFALGIRVG